MDVFVRSIVAFTPAETGISWLLSIVAIVTALGGLLGGAWKMRNPGTQLFGMRLISLGLMGVFVAVLTLPDVLGMSRSPALYVVALALLLGVIAIDVTVRRQERSGRREA